MAADVAAEGVAAVFEVAGEGCEEDARQRQRLARLQMQRQAPETGL